RQGFVAANRSRIESAGDALPLARQPAQHNRCVLFNFFLQPAPRAAGFRVHHRSSIRAVRTILPPAICLHQTRFADRPAPSVAIRGPAGGETHFFCTTSYLATESAYVRAAPAPP